MRTILFIFFTLTIFGTKCQVLDPKVEWFGLNDYFSDAIIKKEKIARIILQISSKKDHKIFYNKGEFLAYSFDAEGRMVKAQKRVALSRRYDTSYILKRYNSKGELIEHEEHNGPFDFHYHYYDRTDSTYRSVKLRPTGKGYDTLYHRKHSIEFKKNQKIELVSNRIGNTFQKVLSTYSETGELLEIKQIYLFNKNQYGTKYTYEEGQLVGKQEFSTYGEKKKNTLWKYHYNGSLLELIEIFENGNLSKKIAFTYAAELPTAIILRSIKDEYVSIYKCQYERY